jgi:hypothetical protein
MPRPAAWASAVALYVVAIVVRAIFATIMPLLVALLQRSPRLAGLGMLVLWLSPIALAAALHDVVGRFVGLRAPVPGESWLGGATSWWVGFVAWATIIVVTLAMAFILLVIKKPPPVDPHGALNVIALLTGRQSGGLGPAIWLVLAAYVYELELRASETTS